VGSKHDTWREDPRDLLRVGEHVDLDGLDRSATPGWDGGKKAASRFGKHRGDLLSELQERLFAEGRAGGSRSLLVVVQGLDTAGKGGVARHVMSKVDPQGVALRSFGPPSDEERKHHFPGGSRRRCPSPA
jgi:polyphosphate kinase 2 (PPK2 family)